MLVQQDGDEEMEQQEMGEGGVGGVEGGEGGVEVRPPTPDPYDAGK